MTLDRAVGAGLVVVATVVGALLALVGAFLVPAELAPYVSLGDVFALVTIGPFCHAVGRALRSSVAAVAPAFAWLFTAVTLGSARTEGDIVVTGTAYGIAFLLLGSVSAAVGIGTIRSRTARADARALARTVQAEPPAADR